MEFGSDSGIISMGFLLFVKLLDNGWTFPGVVEARHMSKDLISSSYRE